MNRGPSALDDLAEIVGLMILWVFAELRRKRDWPRARVRRG